MPNNTQYHISFILKKKQYQKQYLCPKQRNEQQPIQYLVWKNTTKTIPNTIYCIGYCTEIYWDQQYFSPLVTTLPDSFVCACVCVWVCMGVCVWVCMGVCLGGCVGVWVCLAVWWCMSGWVCDLWCVSYTTIFNTILSLKTEYNNRIF